MLSLTVEINMNEGKPLTFKLGKADVDVKGTENGYFWFIFGTYFLWWERKFNHNSPPSCPFLTEYPLLINIHKNLFLNALLLEAIYF